MHSPPIPLMSYVFVGITSLVLALVTVLDTGATQTDNKSPESSTSMLPNIFSTKPATEPSSSMFSSLVPEHGSAEGTIKVGGKKRTTRSNKKHRLSRKSHKK